VRESELKKTVLAQAGVADDTQAIILLPGSPASSLPMTPQTLRDHIAFLSPPISLTSGTPTSNDNTAVLVTLSGLVGTLRG
jgi:hypothetical protein